MLIRLVLALEPASLQERLARILDLPHVLLAGAAGRDALWQHLSTEPTDLLVVSRSVLDDPAAEAIASIRALPGHPDIVVVLERDDPEDRAVLLGAGCLAVVSTEMSDSALRDALERLCTRRGEQGVQRLRAEHPHAVSSLGDFRSSSPAMRPVLDMARRVVETDTSLLILGETGVGKEHLARAIHDEGPRRKGPFVPVSCAAIPETLLESELFGHEEGAFTGAVRAHRGQFEIAHQGTLLLDEIGDLSLTLQIKLLRVLQERKIQRVGGEKTIPVDVRIIAATNANLVHAIRDSRFRADFYYRLSVVSITIPPLRQRREDIPDLVRTYVDRFQQKLRRPIHGIEERCMRALVEYDWPGNVRELINVVERAVLMTEDGIVRLSDVPEVIRGPHPPPEAAPPHPPASSPAFDEAWLDLPLGTVRELLWSNAEREYLQGLLARNRGRINDTAAEAGITTRALYDKMRRHGLRKEDFRMRGSRRHGP